MTEGLPPEIEAMFRGLGLDRPIRVAKLQGKNEALREALQMARRILREPLKSREPAEVALQLQATHLRYIDWLSTAIDEVETERVMIDQEMAP